jgi:hypothetical protein
VITGPSHIPATVSQIIDHAEQIGDATYLMPLTFEPLGQASAEVDVALDGAANPSEIESAWNWLISKARHDELSDLEAAAIAPTPILVDVLGEDGTEKRSFLVSAAGQLAQPERDEALSSLLVQIAALRRKLHETGLAFHFLVAENDAAARDGEDV